MSKEKQLAKNTALYAIGSIGTKILTFLIVPLYTYYIDTSNMGIYDAIITAMSLLSPVAVLSIYEGVYRWSIENRNNAGVYIRYGIKVEFRNLTIIALVLIAVELFIDIPYFLYVLFYLVSMCLHTYFARVARGVGMTKLYTSLGLVYTVLYLTLNLLLIVYARLGIQALLLSSIISYTVTTLIFALCMKNIICDRKENDYILSLHERKRITFYSLANTPNSICWWIVGLSDRFALIWFVSTSVNGIYSISQKFPTVVSLLTTIFYYAWQDQALTTFNDKDKDEYYTSVFKLYSKFLLSMTLCLIPFTKYIVLFMEASYETAWHFVMPLYLGTVFSALASFYGIGYQGSKQNVRALTTTAAAAFVNIAINMIFIPLFPSYGIWIASLSTAISYFVLFVTRAIQCKRYFSIRINKIELSIMIALNIICGIVLLYTGLLADIVIFSACVIIAVLMCKEYFLKVLHLLKRRKK